MLELGLTKVALCWKCCICMHAASCWAG